jgi:hypothetical protein
MQRAHPDMPARRRSRALRSTALLGVLCGLALAFRQGLVPWYVNPLPAIDLADPSRPFADWRLAAMKYNPDLCRRVLVAPYVEVEPVADHPLQDGCGWTNAVRMTSAGGVRAGFDKVTCEAATALALWLEHGVQPAAQDTFGQRVVAVQSFGTYACRNIVGAKFWKDRRSEHAIANAIDIGGFTLANGHHISIRRQWGGDGPEARFLRAAHASACRYFRVALGPNFNPEHHDHFHLDRGIGWVCE